MSFKYKDITIDEATIKIGITAPIQFFHITDSHIAYSDKDAPNQRWKDFGSTPQSAEIYFNQAADYCRKNNIFMLNTGDAIDFLSQANFDFLDNSTQELDYLYAAGNHDFCHCVGDATENKPYKERNIKKVAPHIKSNLYFDSKTVNGINFVTLDNSYYTLSNCQIQMLKAEAAKGLPIILGMHVPLYVPQLAQKTLSESGCTYLINTPTEIVEKFKDPYRRFQQEADEETVRAVDYIINEPLIKAVICGHTHERHDEALKSGVMQYVGEAGFKGAARLFTVI